VVKINLLPSKVRKGKVTLQLYTYLVLAASVAGLVMLLLILNLLAQTRGVNLKIESIKKAELALADKTAPLRELSGQENKIDQIKKISVQLSGGQFLWTQILDELADKTQPDMWLIGLHSEHKDKTDALMLTLEGEAYNKLSVADFLTNLENSNLFDRVNLESLKEIQAKEITQIQFKLKMNCRLAQADALAKEKKP
jgi:Tfp pilus assembly protein PilN